MIRDIIKALELEDVVSEVDRILRGVVHLDPDSTIKAIAAGYALRTIRDWVRRAQLAVDAAASLYGGLSDEAAHTEASALRVTEAAFAKFDGFEEAHAGERDRIIAETYQVGMVESLNAGNAARRAAGMSTIRPTSTNPHAVSALGGLFTSVDEEAIAVAQNLPRLWIGASQLERVHDLIVADVTRIMLSEHRTREAAAEAIRSSVGHFLGQGAAAGEAATHRLLTDAALPKGWRGGQVLYWEMMAAHVTSTARLFGDCRGFEVTGVTRVSWNAVNDERTCECCAFLHGKVIQVAKLRSHLDKMATAKTKEQVQEWWPWVRTSDEVIERSGCSTQEGHVSDADDAKVYDAGIWPPAHASCFPTGTMVEGEFVGGSCAQYSGEIVEVWTAEGRRLTMTPNHPILTAEGFAAAGSLHKGDYLVCDLREARIALLRSRVQGDNNEGPTSVEDFYRSLAKAGTGVCPASTVDFHGDAVCFESKINVVGTYRELLRHRNPLATNQGSKIVLKAPSIAEIGHTSFGLSDALVEWDLSSPSGFVRRSDLSSDTLGIVAHRTPLDRLGLRLTAGLDPVISQDTVDREAGDPALIRELLGGSPCTIALDKIVLVRKHDFRGHVFDLQSKTGYIIAHGIYTSNCRCWPEIADDNELLTDDEIDAAARQRAA